MTPLCAVVYNELINSDKYSFEKIS